jgi:hypothetical protein
MSTAHAPARVPAAPVKKKKKDPQRMHRVRFRISIGAAVALIGWFAYFGWPYYRLDMAHRVSSPLHASFKPSGTMGTRLGLIGVVLYLILFLYAARKRVTWLGRFGKAGNWFDFHVVCGISAPILITMHTTFKFGGLAGAAYWIMIAVAVSGFVGRYLYSQIPRRLNAAEISNNELEFMAAALGRELEEQQIVSPAEIAGLLELPSRETVNSMSTLTVLRSMLWLDLRRPFLVRRLRARFLTGAERVWTLNGLLATNHAGIERVISAIRRQTWLRAKVLFLGRVQALFLLWHVVHRPFSYTFAALALIHISVVLLLGYY